METYGVAALGALGDPTRRAIFECLARRPMAVGELSAELPVSRPAVSQHLKVLKQAGLVADRADGTRRIYQVSSGGIQAIRTYLDQMWSQALAGFEQAARQMAEPGAGAGKGREHAPDPYMTPERHTASERQEQP